MVMERTTRSPLRLVAGVTAGCLACGIALAAGGAAPRGKGNSTVTTVTGDVNVINTKVVVGGGGVSSGLVVGNGKRVARQLPVPATTVSGIELSGVFDANITCGQPMAVELVVDENLHALVSVVVEKGMLSVRFAKPVQTQESPRLQISLPGIASLRLAGNDTVRVTGVSGKRLSLEQSGTGSVTVAGKVESLVCQVSGVGDVDAGKLKCVEAVVTVTGVGDVTCRPENKLRTSISGIGGVRCLTRPADVDREGTGLGDVEFVGGR